MYPKNQIVRFLITLMACFQDYQISKEAEFTPKSFDLWSSNDSSNVLNLLNYLPVTRPLLEQTETT